MEKTNGYSNHIENNNESQKEIIKQMEMESNSIDTIKYNNSRR